MSLTRGFASRGARLLYRSDRVYSEAAKCYLNALRAEPDNTQILTDLALLQVQLRDAPGFVATRTRLLHLKPSTRANWIALAVAHHLAGHRAVAVSVLEQYAAIAPEDRVPLSERYEASELALYRAWLLEEDGRPAWALAHLDTAQAAGRLVDVQGACEARAALQLQLGQGGEAEASYRTLIELNPDTLEYHAGLRAALGLGGDQAALSDDGVARLVSVYAELAKQYPRSSAVKRLPLDFLRGPAFEAAAARYVRPFLRKGVPALFSDLAPLYASADKAAALGRIVAETEASLRQRSAFPGDPDGSEEPPALAWALHLAAQHAARIGDVQSALRGIDAALEHTPTVIDFYVTKSRMLAQAGDMGAAADVADEARRMDLADRYLNSVAVQALLAADRISEAETTAALFARPSGLAPGESPPPGATNLIDMQCQWFALGVGDAHARAQRWGPALKRYTQVRKHFEDFQEDQFDFHAYCVRKMTLRAYVRMLRLVDKLPGHAFFRRAAAGAIRAYLAIADAAAAEAAGGGAAAAAAAEEAALAALPPNERKKLRAKARKAEQQAGAAAAASAAAGAAASSTGGVEKKGGKPVDPDPEGATLAACADPLGEATKWVASLVQHAGEERATHVLAAEVYCRKGRLLLALRSARKLRAATSAAAGEDAAAEAAAAHVVTVRLLRDAAAALQRSGEGAVPPPVATVLREGAAELLAGAKDAAALNAAWLQAQGGNAKAKEAHAAAAALLA